jgi:hypothetical protein
LYKGLSQRLQRSVGRLIGTRFRPYVPKTKAQLRSWWYPMIAQSLKVGTDIQKHSSARLPGWLRVEVESYGMTNWLASWNKKTGTRKLPDKRKKM